MPQNTLPYFIKLASDELKDTLFFATGEIPVSEKFPDYSRILKAGFLTVKIVHPRKILVNGDLCKSSAEAKYCIQELLYSNPL